MQRPASRNRWGETLDEEAVRSLVAKGMRQHGIRGPVFVRQRIMGAMDDERVGVVAERHVQVMPATPAAP
ncbi:MAG: hypothetical protein FJX56_14860 [Alphaproteobacteria bacterium]|nr:hypothetical protein [Alphaproteobacteria bacterium]